MVNPDTEVIFPPRVIAALVVSPGAIWPSVAGRAQNAAPDSPEQCAFVLMMARMCGCGGCNADSFRAMRGCTQCARQTAKRYRGSEAELIETYTQCLREVQAVLLKTP